MIDHCGKAIPTFGSNYRKAEPGVPGRRLDDMPAIGQQTAPLGIVDHGARHPDLGRARRIELLQFQQQPGAGVGTGQFEQRGAADQIRHARDERHGCLLIKGLRVVRWNRGN
ncbi:hypothetical protein GCM10027088_20910 [Nocardia goodfellowii]